MGDGHRLVFEWRAGEQFEGQAHSHCLAEKMVIESAADWCLVAGVLACHTLTQVSRLLWVALEEELLGLLPHL